MGSPCDLRNRIIRIIRIRIPPKTHIQTSCSEMKTLCDCDTVTVTHYLPFQSSLHDNWEIVDGFPVLEMTISVKSRY